MSAMPTAAKSAAARWRSGKVAGCAAAGRSMDGTG
jgi:hypothetical protein